MRVTVRYFGAAANAAGTQSAKVDLPEGADIAALTRVVGENAKLWDVLERCSFLRNEIAIGGSGIPLHEGDIVDVLPPFAGGAR